MVVSMLVKSTPRARKPLLANDSGTPGTQLAEEGARNQTIMAILGTLGWQTTAGH
jgi:hypothetical protein